MRKLRFILPIAVLLCSLLSGGCVNEFPNAGYGGGDAQIQLELSTYAVNGSADPNATEEEKLIKSAYVFIFNSAGVLENAGSTAVTTTTANGEVINDSKMLNAKWRVYKGLKDIYIVANPDTELAGRLVSLSATNTFQKSTLLALLTEESAFAADIAAFSGKGMIMTGKGSGTAVSGSTTTVPVTVTRRHARIDFMLRKAKDLEGATVVVKGVNYKDQIQKTIVFPSTPTAATTHTETTTTNVTVSAQQAVAGVSSSNVSDYTAVQKFYTYEKARGTEAACLEMTVSINGGADKVLPVYISRTGNDKTQPMAIEANTVYKVLGTLTRQSVDFTLIIVPWDDEEVKGDIYGDDFTVSKTKFVLLPGENAVCEMKALENITYLGYDYNGTSGTAQDAIPFLTVTNLPAGTSQTASVDITFGASKPVAPIYLWFKAGNIKKRIEVSYKE